MITHLHIENYALIQHTDIDFGPSMTAITGETGAGKSILLGALGLLMGQRADSQVLQDKEKKCVVEAFFDDDVILRREILPSAKSRAFVDDSPVTLDQLRATAARLLDIHSQHQTLTLADSAFQRDLLDTLSPSAETGRAPVSTETTDIPTTQRRAHGPSLQYADAFAEYQRLKKHLEELTSADQQARREQDYHQFLFDELNEAHLVEGEQEELEQESSLLANAEGIKEALSTVLSLCDSDSGDSALSRLSASRQQLSRIASTHPDAQALSERMESSLIELKDILSEVESFNDRIAFSPDRQQQVDERLDLLYRLEKKHSVSTVQELIALRDELDEKLQAVAHLDEEIHAAMEAVDKVFAKVQQEAERLTALRQQAARQLEKEVLPLLSDLGMKEARLVVEVTPTSTYTPHGCDSIRFLFNANRGGELRELGKVASGGELSRLMLALKSLTARQSLLPTIIFDEIDTGVSGDISSRMAAILSGMGQHMQVIAITHLPQMAAVAADHLKVYKQVEADTTVSHIRPLTPDERVQEIAVMLSSDPPTESACQTARELLGIDTRMKN